jgi:hypothetical protein
MRNITEVTIKSALRTSFDANKDIKHECRIHIISAIDLFGKEDDFVQEMISDFEIDFNTKY